MATIFLSNYISARGKLVKHENGIATIMVNGRLMHGRLAVAKGASAALISQN